MVLPSSSTKALFSTTANMTKATTVKIQKKEYSVAVVSEGKKILSSKLPESCILLSDRRALISRYRVKGRLMKKNTRQNWVMKYWSLLVMARLLALEIIQAAQAINRQSWTILWMMQEAMQIK